jgi:hypothetical protein
MPAVVRVEEAAASAPYRYFPSMAAAQRHRLPTADQLQDWCRHAGLANVYLTHVTRPVRIVAGLVEHRVHVEIAHRYPEITPDELSGGLQQLHEDEQQHGGPWHEPRTHTIVIAHVRH